MRFDVVVVGGGTAGCVVAARLSEQSDRRVCLLEAGPDYGPLADGRWPPEMVDGRRMPWTHSWGDGGEDEQSLGARIIGGCSAHNACVMVEGSPADYDEWGGEWAYERFAPFLDRARTTLRTVRRNTVHPGPYYDAILDAAVAAGFPLLADADDPPEPVGIATCPVNLVDGTRWNAAFAYLDPARARPNLSITGATMVDRVLLDGSRAVGVVSADGRRFDADTVILTAGAYLSPAVLWRSGIGPASELSRHGIDVVAPLPVGERLLDHYGSSISWMPSAGLEQALAAHEREHDLYEINVVLKAASTSCAPGTWDIHVLPSARWSEELGRYEVRAVFFHMKPLSTGRLRFGSADPAALPIVERGFFSRPEDLRLLLDALELVRTLAKTAPLSTLLAAEVRPGDDDPERFLRETTSSYFHPAGTCAIGKVVDTDCRVLGMEGLLVVDASVMPTIPRANTNLTTAAIAERIATTFGS